jgi:hypothetical protein
VLDKPICGYIDVAINELVSLQSTAREGTSYFKRKYADIKKVSYRSHLGIDHARSKFEPSAHTKDIDEFPPDDFALNDSIAGHPDSNTLSASITFQQRRSSHDRNAELSHESYITKQLIKLIEEREAALKGLESLISNNRHDPNADEYSSELKLIVNKLIESTNLVIDGINKWENASLAKGLKRNDIADRSTSSKLKQYCVIITGDSHELYQASPPIHSSLAKMIRDFQPAKRHTDMIFVGSYETREEAETAFNHSIVKSIRGNVNDKAVYDTSMYISMRPCLKHILFRSRGVSKYIPCESCIALQLQSHQHSLDSHQLRFTWRGQDYGEKIRADFKILYDQLPQSSYLSEYYSKLTRSLDWSQFIKESNDLTRSSTSVNKASIMSTRTSKNSLMISSKQGKLASSTQLSHKSMSSTAEVAAWCDPTGDSEYKGFTQGKHVRAFYRQEALKAKGKEKLKEINRMQRLLRACVQAGVGVWKVDDIRNLIDRAKALSNHALAIDIGTVEKHLSKTLSCIACVKKIQARYRGYRGRCTFLELLSYKNLRLELLKLTEKTAKKLAVGFVSSVIGGCITSLAKALDKPFFIRTVSENHRYLLKIKPEASQLIKMPDQCQSCLRGSSSNAKSICTCQLQRYPEEWRITLYEPLSGDHRNIVISTDYILAAINLALMGGLYISSSTSNSSSTRDLITPVTQISPASLVKHIAGKSTASDDRTASVSNWLAPSRALDVPQASKYKRKWEPIHEVSALNLQLRDCDWKLASIQSRISRISQSLEESDLKQQFEKLALYEQSCFAYEDALSSLYDLADAYQLADKRIRNVMDLSLESAIITSIDDDFSTITDDWKQSWDAFVDGNAWAGLNCKRKIEALISKNAELRKNLVIECQLRKSDYECALVTQSEMKKQLLSLESTRLLCEEKMKAIEEELHINEEFANLAATISVQALPISRIWNDYHCHPLATNRLYPYHIDKCPWNLLRREIVTIYKNRDATMRLIDKNKACEKFHYLIEIYDCSIQKQLILHIKGHSIEENVQHLDFHLSPHHQIRDNKNQVQRSATNDVMINPLSSLSFESPLIAIMSTLNQNSDSFFIFPNSSFETKIHRHKNTEKPTHLMKMNRRQLVGRFNRGYLQAREDRKRKQEEYLQTIVSSIRVHPHSQRPCIGTTILKHRVHHLDLSLKPTSWFHDLLILNPMLSRNACMMHNGIYLISKQLYSLVFVWKMSEVEVHLTSCWDAQSSIIFTISLHQILRSLESSPMLKSIFQIEHITNRYSRAIERFIADHVSVYQDTHDKSIHDTPIVTYIENETVQLSQDFSCYRMISSLWFHVNIEMAETSNLHIILSAPRELDRLLRNSNIYQGREIHINLTKAEVRKLLWRFYVKSKQSEVDIFLDQNRELLYNVLLEHLHLNDIHVRNHDANASRSRSSDDRVGSMVRYVNQKDEDISIQIIRHDEWFAGWMKRRYHDYQLRSSNDQEANDENWCFIRPFATISGQLSSDANSGSVEIFRQICQVPLRFDDARTDVWVREEKYKRSLLSGNVDVDNISSNRPSKTVVLHISRTTTSSDMVYHINLQSSSATDVLFDEVYADQECLSMGYEDLLSAKMKQNDARSIFEDKVYQLLEYYRDKLSDHTFQLRSHDDQCTTLLTRLSILYKQCSDRLARSTRYVGSMELLRMERFDSADYPLVEVVEAFESYTTDIMGSLKQDNPSVSINNYCNDDCINSIARYKQSSAAISFRDPLAWYHVRDQLCRSSNCDMESNVIANYARARKADRDHRLFIQTREQECATSAADEDVSKDETFVGESLTVKDVDINESQSERNEIQLELIRGYILEAYESSANRLRQHLKPFQERVCEYKDIVDSLHEMLSEEDFDLRSLEIFGKDPISEKCFLDRQAILSTASLWFDTPAASWQSKPKPVYPAISLNLSESSPIIYGIFIPCNEQLDITPFITKGSARFLQICSNTLHCPSQQLARAMNTRFCIYSSEGVFDRTYLQNLQNHTSRSKGNRRLSRLSTVLQLKNKRVEMIYKALTQSSGCEGVHYEHSDTLGNIVIMLRKGEADFRRILSLLKLDDSFAMDANHEDLGLEIKQELIERSPHYKADDKDLHFSAQGLTTNRLRENYQQFLTALAAACQPFLSTFERILDQAVPRHQSHREDISIDLIRLLSSYQQFISSHDEEACKYLREEAALLDSSIVNSSMNRLQLFHIAPCIDEAGVRSIISGQVSSSAESSAAGRSMNVNLIHITHMLFALHCSSCKQQRRCRISICKHFHQLQNDDEKSSYEGSRGKGFFYPSALNHILCDARLHASIIRSSYINLTIMSKGSASFQAKEKEIVDDTAIPEAEEERFNWRQLLLEKARMMHLLHQHIPIPMRPLFQTQSSSSETSCYYQQKAFSLEYQDNLTLEDERVINYSDRSSIEDSSSGIAESSPLPSISLSEETVFKLLSYAWFSPFIRPSSQTGISTVQEVVDAVSIAQRIRDHIIPRLELNHRSKDRVSIDYDRQLEERLVAFAEGLVRIRILIGILRDTKVSSSRYCDISDLDAMLNGFTIVVLSDAYDSPKIVHVESQTCILLVELLKSHHNVTCKDMLSLVSASLDRAALLLDLRYMQGQLVNVEFNISRLIPAMKGRIKPAEVKSAASDETKSTNARRYRIQSSSIAKKIDRFANFE